MTQTDTTENTQPTVNVESVGPLTGLAAWDGEGRNCRLALTPQAVSRVRKKALSPSTADAIRSCPSRWAIEQLLPRTTDPFGAAELGTAAHQLFEDLFTHPQGERGLATAASILDSLNTEHLDLKAPKNPDGLARWKNEVHRRMVGLWDIEDPNTITVVASELHLKTNVFGIPFNGYIDRVDRTADGGLKVVDYKAGMGKMKAENAKYGDPHGDQARLYVEALKSHQADMVAGAAEIFYVFHKKMRVIDLSDKAMAGTQVRYEKSWHLLNTQTASGRFAMKTSPLCGWCPAVNVCPAAIAAGKVAKVPTAEHGELLGIGGGPTPVAVTVSAKTQGVGQPESTPDEIAAFNTESSTSSDTTADAGYDPGIDFNDDLVVIRLPLDFEQPPLILGGPPLPSPDSPSPSPQPCTQCGVALTTTGICASCASEDDSVWGPETAPPSSSTEKDQTTVGGASIMFEDKPWEETTGDGGLNLNAYAATAAFGLVELAVESLHEHDQKVSARSVDALTETLAIIVEHVQVGLGITPSMQAGSHTRLRGALRTSLDTIPPPFGEDTDEWELWVAKSENRIKAITKAAIRLWEGGGSDEKPWAILATTPPKLQAVK